MTNTQNSITPTNVKPPEQPLAPRRVIVPRRGESLTAALFREYLGDDKGLSPLDHAAVRIAEHVDSARRDQTIAALLGRIAALQAAPLACQADAK